MGQNRDLEVLLLPATVHLQANDQGVVGEQNRDLEAVLLLQATAHLQANDQGVVGGQNRDQEVVLLLQAIAHLPANDQGVVGQQNRDHGVVLEHNPLDEIMIEEFDIIKHEVEAGNRFYNEKWPAPA